MMILLPNDNGSVIAAVLLVEFEDVGVNTVFLGSLCDTIFSPIVSSSADKIVNY
jgi:hypothetical protein